MLGFIVSYAVNRPVAVIMSAILVLVLGIVSIGTLSVDFYPPVCMPQLTVATSCAGLPAGEVLDLLTIPIEDTLSTLRGIKHLQSSSLDGISIIECSFSWGTDMREAGIQARELSDIASLSLPDGASKPMVLPVNPAQRPILSLGVFAGEGMKQTDLKRLCSREISSLVQQADGVGSIQILGGLDEQILIEPDPSLLNAYGLTIRQLSNAVEAAGMEVPAGSIESGSLEYLIKTESTIKDTPDIGDIRVASSANNGPGIYLRDIASIKAAPDDRASFVTRGDKEGIALLVRSQSGFSPVSLSENVRGKISEIEAAYGHTIDIQVLQDSSILISESIRNLVYSGLLGMVIAFAVVIWYLRDPISSLIMISSIPVSLVTALACFPLLRIGINTMSIGGLAIGVGMLVDNSVVVLENIRKKADPTRRQAVIFATMEIADSTIGSTLTSIVVFMPLFFLPDVIGAVFRDLAWSVSLSLASSFIVSITVVPVFFCQSRPHTNRIIRTGLCYRRFLAYFLRNPGVIAIVAGTILIAGCLCLSFLDMDLLRIPSSGSYTVEISFPPGTTQEYLIKAANDLSSDLETTDTIRSCWFYAGGEFDDPQYLATKSPDGETLHCCLEIGKDIQNGAQGVELLLRKCLGDANIQRVTAIPSALSFNEILGINTIKTLTFAVCGDTSEEAYGTAQSIAESADDPEIRLYPQQTSSRLLLSPRREAMQRSAIDASAIASFVGDSVIGLFPGFLDTERGRIPIRIRLPREYRSSVGGIKSLRIPVAGGSVAPLPETVSFSEESVPPAHFRRDRQNVVYLDVPADKRAIVESLSTRYEEASSSFWRERIPAIALLFFLSIFMMYVLLGIQFGSFLLPLLLMCVIPFGFAGVFIALCIRGCPLDLNAILGSLVVIGVIVNNGIIFYDRFNRTIRSPRMAAGCVYRGANDRIRSISISFLTTFFALIPVAANIGGNNPQCTMATAIIGGLGFANFLSIFAFPVIFSIKFSAVQGGPRHDH